MVVSDDDWWRTTTVYQVYPRSFADGNGDGVGDLAGIVDRLDYIASLGFQTVWVSPFFRSPQRDFGYDISDYTDVAEEYGTLADAQLLVDEAHKRGLKLVLDMVLNHTSDQHPWFVDSRSSKSSEHADYYIWRDGRGPFGRLPPNNWRSAMEVRTAWQFDRSRRQWFLASFLPCQPDLNWRNPAVREAMWEVVRFWLDKGVDGFRLDMFHAIMKDPQFRDNPIRPTFGGSDIFRIWRRDHTDNTADNFELARELRRVCSTFRPERVLIGEVFGRPEVLRRYLGEGDGLHLTFLFDFLAFRYSANFFRKKIAAYEREYPSPLLPTYVLENHDRSRSLSRAGGDPRRARVLAAMLLTLRGVPTVYQGQEIGMTNTYIPLREAKDPIAQQYFAWVPEAVSKRLTERINRDEVRTPMQWTAGPNAGFCPPGVDPWLPVNPNHVRVNVETEESDPASLLNWYRTLLTLRRERPSLATGSLELLHGMDDDVLAYIRRAEGESILVFLNFSDSRRICTWEVRPASVLARSDPEVYHTGSRVHLPPHSACILEIAASRS